MPSKPWLNGCSRNGLAPRIKTRLHERLGTAPTNCAATLPAPQSDLGVNLLKDPYNFDFLSLGKEAHEREIEGALIERKVGRFQPEYSGKLSFYLSAVDDLPRTEGDALTIGILLCQEKNRVIAGYARRDLGKPIGVSSYELTSSLPPEIQTSLPTIAELEQELSYPPE